MTPMPPAATEVELDGTQIVNGVLHYILRYTNSEVREARIWIDSESILVAKLGADPPPDTELDRVVLDFFDYDVPFTISMPCGHPNSEP